MQTPPRKGLAVTDGWSHVRLWLTVGLGVAADWATKHVGWNLLGGPPEGGGHEVAVIPGWLRLVCSENPGIVFGFNFSEDLGLGEPAARAVTILLTVATSALIFYVFAASRRAQRWVHLWCGLILAGAVGNLIDRVCFGHVRDLIQFTVQVGGRPVWPFVFNLADVYLVLGVAAIAIAMLRAPAPGKQPAPRGRSRKES